MIKVMLWKVPSSEISLSFEGGTMHTRERNARSASTSSISRLLVLGC